MSLLVSPGFNLTVDVFMGMDIKLDSTGWSFHKYVASTGKDYDPLFVENSLYMRLSALATACAGGGTVGLAWAYASPFFACPLSSRAPPPTSSRDT